MEDTNVSPAQPQPNADQRLAELEQRYAASSAEGKRLAAELSKWQAYAQQVEQQAQQAQPASRNATDRLAEQGYPVPDLEEFVASRVAQAVDDRLRPLSQLGTARAELMAKYGEDYQKFEPEVFKFVSSDPETNQRFNQMLKADAGAANEWAYLKYADQQRRSAPAQNGQVIQNAQVQASIPQSRSGDVRLMGDDKDGTARELWGKFLETRDPRYRDAYVKVRYSQAVPDEFLNK